jgi:Phosphotransferase enzyme family
MRLPASRLSAAMFFTDPILELREFRLAMILPMSMRVLALSGGELAKLPRVSTPWATRPAAAITKAIQKQWGLKAIVLEMLWPTDITSPCAVVEIFPDGKESYLADGLIAVRCDDLPQIELNLEERSIVLAIMSGDPGGRGPFSRMGWLWEAMDWMRSIIPGAPEFSGFRQINAGPGFALVRFSTTQDCTYWLKATGAPNRHEFDITTKLSQICPEYLPTVVASRRDWNTWVEEDAGNCLEEVAPFSQLECAVSALTGLHQRTMNRIEELKICEFPHRSISTLQDSLSELVEFLQEAMALQRSTRVPRLDNLRLRQLGDILRDACDRMRDLPIPDSVVHNDLSRGNILFDEERCVFIDWCEAFIGNPFFNFHRLTRLLPSIDEDRERDLVALRTIYKGFWLGSLTPSQIDEAFLLVPLLAAASDLYARGDWFRSAHRRDPSVQSYARTVARYIDRAAQAPAIRGILCH